MHRPLNKLMTITPLRALSRIRMAMVISVQHLEQISAALKKKQCFVIKCCVDLDSSQNI